jgi:HD-like signal output (HDOD) protein
VSSVAIQRHGEGSAVAEMSRDRSAQIEAAEVRLRERFRANDRAHPLIEALYEVALAKEAQASPEEKRFEEEDDRTPDPSPKIDSAQLLKNVRNIGTLPSVYIRLTKVLSDARSSTKDVAFVVEHDPGLTARVLRLANSAYLGFACKIDSVSRAIAMLGREQLRDLALATSVIQTLRKSSKTQIGMEAFWRHSLATGIAARTIAFDRGEPNCERYFVSGLLHDLGLLILGPGSSASNDADPEGAQHGVAGQLLLEQWKLPHALSTVARWHHAPSFAQKHLIEVATVHVADMVAYGLGYGHVGAWSLPKLTPRAWEVLCLPPSAVQRVATQIEGQLAEVTRILLCENQ